jgi:NAD(P) transhydrogenase
MIAATPAKGVWMAPSPRYDLIVIGSGPAGEKGAAQTAYFGKRVALVEKEPVLGGAAANTGTLPSKTLRETSLYLSGYRQRGLFGVDFELKREATVRDLLYRERLVAETERQRVRRNLDRHGVELHQGCASLVDAHTVAVRRGKGVEKRLSGDVILVATGSHPNRPRELQLSHPLVHDSDTILSLQEIPRSLAVVGGGVIGCEYACIFAALGIEVTLI